MLVTCVPPHSPGMLFRYSTCKLFSVPAHAAFLVTTACYLFFSACCRVIPACYLLGYNSMSHVFLCMLSGYPCMLPSWLPQHVTCFSMHATCYMLHCLQKHVERPDPNGLPPSVSAPNRSTHGIRTRVPLIRSRMLQPKS